jgi:hypothetical protein
VYPSIFAAVPALPFLAEINWSGILTDYVLPIGILVLIFFVPHVVAARIFTPKSNVLLVIAACVMQLLFILLVVWIVAVLALAGIWYLIAGGILVFVMSTLIITGVYRLEFVKGLGYSAVALVMIGTLSWAMVKFYPEVVFRRIATPTGMQLIRWASKFQTSEADAKRIAVKQFPELAVPGSDFNRRFLARVAKYRAESPEELRSPGWPLVVAAEIGFEKQSIPLLGSPSSPEAAGAR